jgi:predicted ATPase
MRRSSHDGERGDGGYLRELCLLRDRAPSFSRYPFSLPAVRHLTSLALHPQVTFLIGENGSGKSTLMEAIAVAWGFNAEGGSRNFAFTTRASHSELSDCLRLTRAIARPRDGFFLRAESFYNVATEIERLDEEPAAGRRVIDSYGGRSLHEQSHGESFWALFMHRFSGCGLYLLDEPEAALSPTRQMAMLARLHQLVGQHSQFIIATHSPIILAYPHAKIVQLSPDGLEDIQYEETEHYLVTRQFLMNPERMLARLLEPDRDA